MYFAMKWSMNSATMDSNGIDDGLEFALDLLVLKCDELDQLRGSAMMLTVGMFCFLFEKS